MEHGIKSPSLHNWSQGVATQGLRPTPQALTQPGFAAPWRKNSAWRLKHLSHSSKEERALTLIQKLSLKILAPLPPIRSTTTGMCEWGPISRRGRKWTILVASKAMGHGARDQVTVSMQMESGRGDLKLKPAPSGADPTRVCGTIAEKLHHGALNTSVIPRKRNGP